MLFNAADAVATATPGKPGTGTGGLPVLKVGVVYRDHRQLDAADQAAYSATLSGYRRIVTALSDPKVIARLINNNVSPTDPVGRQCHALLALQNLGSGPSSNTIAALAECRRRAQVIVGRLLAGLWPFATITNAADGTKWNKFFNATSRTLYILPRPKEGWGLDDLIADAGHFIVAAGQWAWDKITDAAKWACGLLNDPDSRKAQAAAQTVLVEAGVVSGGVTATVVGTVEVARGFCALAFAPAPGQGAPPSPPTAQPLPFKYPAGSLARLNTDTGRWSIYVPLAGGGLGEAILPDLRQTRSRDRALGYAAVGVVAITVGTALAVAFAGGG